MSKKPRFPIPRYPRGWFQVAYSDELEAGEVQPLKYFGVELVMFRTEDGEVSVLDAFCPHMGAHLGYGGKVDGLARTRSQRPHHGLARHRGKGARVGDSGDPGMEQRRLDTILETALEDAHAQPGHV
ncbi:MAG: Rieske 2Fe-2S domain-containing protein [Deltaproteobacteria bacterium]|nr:Rieske 2Fe-2S domain-containing protein [Deltaproteobacteria bacterium]